MLRIDPVTNLGLSAESVCKYIVGEITRTKDGDPPELLPCGYLVGDNTSIQIHVKGRLQRENLARFESCLTGNPCTCM